MSELTIRDMEQDEDFAAWFSEILEQEEDAAGWSSALDERYLILSNEIGDWIGGLRYWLRAGVAHLVDVVVLPGAPPWPCPPPAGRVRTTCGRVRCPSRGVLDRRPPLRRAVGRPGVAPDLRARRLLGTPYLVPDGKGPQRNGVPDRSRLSSIVRSGDTIFKG